VLNAYRGKPYSAVGGPSVSSSVTSMKKLVALSTGKRRLLLTSRLGKLTRIVSADRKAVWKAYDRAALPQVMMTKPNSNGDISHNRHPDVERH